jgi:hypothetical protein
MRALVAILLITVAGCSVPSYSLRSSSSTPLVAANDTTGRQPLIIVLAPSPRRGHSDTWKSGAIITFASIGVTLAGAALTVAGLGPNPDSGYGGNGDMFIAGLVVSALGDAGAFIAGPITWMAGIHGRD